MNWLRYNYHPESGKAESKVPAIITLIILGILIFLTYKFAPVKWRNMKFKQDVQQLLNIDYARQYKEVAKGAFNEYTMREKVLEIAKKYKIPIKDANKQVVVKWPEQKIFTVEVNYTEEVNLPIYGVYPVEFHVYLEQLSATGD